MCVCFFQKDALNLEPTNVASCVSKGKSEVCINKFFLAFLVQSREEEMLSLQPWCVLLSGIHDSKHVICILLYVDFTVAFMPRNSQGLYADG